MGVPSIILDEVREFWDANPCDSVTASATDRLAYFTEIERTRYARQPHILKAGQFSDFGGKRVLEIGCGLGTDGVQFAKAGSAYTGVDLTPAAVRLTQENFTLRRLPGEFQQVNAERLPFAAGEFDHVYSFGVIHHTVNPAAIVNEILRILRPGGTITVMLYNRTSVNYYLQIMFLRKLGRLLLRPTWTPAFFATLLRLPREKLEGHRENMRRIPRPTQEEWLSMNTDGPDCPLARVYSAKEVEAVFQQFENVRTEAHFFDRAHWPLIGRLIPDNLAEKIGQRWGWHRLIFAAKPKS